MSYDGTARTWDVRTGMSIVTYTNQGPRHLKWNADTGQEVRRFSGHTEAVRDVAFSPEGKYILTASEGGTARLWHTDLSDTIYFVCSLLTRDLTPDERAE